MRRCWSPTNTRIRAWPERLSADGDGTKRDPSADLDAGREPRRTDHDRPCGSDLSPVPDRHRAPRRSWHRRSRPHPGTPTITQIADFDRIDANRDGRGNENIALTAAHSVFHARHNRLVEENKLTILETAAGGDVTFLNEWLLVDVSEVPADRSTLLWDGERMLQAARFVTEMPYQHLVLEEFARRVQANVDPFVFTNTPALRLPDISGGIGQLRPNSAARSR
jgi:hypothetical protein